MKKFIAFFLVLLMFIPLFLPVLSLDASAEIISVEKKPLKLWYDKEAPYGNDSSSTVSGHGYGDRIDTEDDGWERWSFPQGNGLAGINVFGRTESERIQITDNTMSTKWSLPTVNGVKATAGGTNSFSDTYIDLGHTNEDVENYIRELDIRTAVSTVNYTYGGVDYSREYFVSYPDKAIVIRLSASGEGNLSFTLRPTIPWEQDYEYTEGDGYSKHGTVVANNDGTITLSGNLGYYNVDFAGRYKIINNGGTITATNGTNEDGETDNGTLTLEGATSAYILITLSTNYELREDVFTTSTRANKLQNSTVDALETAEGELAAASAYSYEELKARHIADYDELFSRVDIDLGGEAPSVTTDVLLSNYKNGDYSQYLEELFFQYGRYLLISSSRDGGVPANLTGIWSRYKNSAWGNYYTHDLNIQMNYWPAFSTNLAETFKPYVDYYNAYRAQAEANATKAVGSSYPDMLGKDGGNGWTIANGADPYWIDSAVSGGNAAFMTQVFWDYYDYTRDEKILAETVYPILKNTMLFITKTMEEQEDGTYLNGWDYSPEQKMDGAWYYTKGVTYIQSLAYMTGINALQAADILGIDSTDEGESILATLKEQVPNYDPILVGYSGQVKEFREEDYYGEIGRYDHRHISHLLGLYPGNLINSSTPAWVDAARYTLTARDNPPTSSEPEGDLWGWSLAHRMSMWASTGDGDTAYDLYNKLLRTRVATNLWALTTYCFQIDANFGGTAGVSEMLLQSNGDYIEPLSALPSAWASGSYSGLVARGSFEVAAKWENGNATTFNITSNSGNTCRVKYHGLANAVIKTSGGTVVPYTINGDIITFNTTKGETYVISNIGEKAELQAPTAMTATALNKNDYALTWSASEDARSYNVYKALESSPTYTLLGNVSGTAYTYSTETAEENKRMTYRVCAVDAAGNESDGALCYVNPTEAEITAISVTASGSSMMLSVGIEGDTPSGYTLWEKNSDGSYTKIAESEYPILFMGGYDADAEYAISCTLGYFETSPTPLPEAGEDTTGITELVPYLVALERFADTTEHEAKKTEAKALYKEIANSISDGSITKDAISAFIKQIIALVDPSGKRQAFIESFTNPADMNSYYAFDASDSVTSGQNAFIYGVSNTTNPNYSYTTSTSSNRLYLYNSLNSVFSFVNENGNYVLKRSNGNSTKASYIAIQPGDTSAYKGKSFVIELDARIGANIPNCTLVDVYTGSTKTSLVALASEGRIRPVGTSAHLGSISSTEFSRISVFVDVPSNLFYLYLDGILLNPSGQTFLATANSEYQLTEVRMFSNYTQNTEMYFDNITMYYTDSFDGSRNDTVWYEGTGIAYDGTGYFYGSSVSKWVSFNDGMRYFDENGYMLIGEHTVDGVERSFSSRGVVASCGDDAHTLSEATCQRPATCTVCGQTVGEPLPHSGGTATCKDRAICSTCGEEYGEPSDSHTPAEDDGNCMSDILCSVCDAVITEGAPAHSFTDDNDISCNNSGCSYIRVTGEFAPYIAALERFAKNTTDEILKNLANSLRDEVVSRLESGNVTDAEAKALKSRIIDLVDPNGKRQAFIESFANPADMNGYYAFDANDTVTSGQNASVIGAQDTADPNYSYAASASQNRLFLYNSLNSVFSFVNENGNYVLKRSNGNSTKASYIGLLPGDTSAYKGKSFVIELDARIGANIPNCTLVDVYTGSTKISLVALASGGRIRPVGTSAHLGSISSTEFSRISVFVDVPNNLFYLYLDGVLLNPSGQTFLATANSEYQLTEVRMFSNYTQNTEMYFDNITMYYTDSFDGSRNDRVWYEGTGIAYDGTGYFYESATSKWVSFDDGMRYFDENGYMLIGEHTVNGESYSFDSCGVLTGEISLGINHNISLYSDFIYNIYLPASNSYVSILLDGVTYAAEGLERETIEGVEYYVLSTVLAPDQAGKELLLKLELVLPNGSEASISKTVGIIDYSNALLSSSDDAISKLLIKDMLSYIRSAYRYSKDIDSAELARVTSSIDEIIGEDYDSSSLPLGTDAVLDTSSGFDSAALLLDARPSFIFYPKLDEEGNPVYPLESYVFALDGKYRLEHTISTDEDGRSYFLVATPAYAFDNRIEYIVDGTEIHGEYNLAAYREFAKSTNNEALISLVDRLTKYVESAEAYRNSLVVQINYVD